MTNKLVELKNIRKSRGLTQMDVAISLNVTRSGVAMWEAGTSMPRGDLLPALADLLHCSIDELYGREAVGNDQTAS